MAWQDRRTLAVLPPAGILALVLLAGYAGSLEARWYLFLGVPIAATQYLYGAAPAGALTIVLAALTLRIFGRDPVLAPVLPLFLAAVWGAAIFIMRTFHEQVFKLRLAGEEDLATASDVAKALEKERERINASRQRIEKIHMLTNLAHDLSSSLDIRSVVTTTLVRTRELTGQTGEARLVQFDADGVRSWRSQDGGAAMGREEADPLVLWVKKRALPLIVTDLPRDLRFREAEGELPSLRSMIGAPLFQGTSVIGVLQVASAQPDAFNPEDLRLLSLLGDLTSVAVQNAELYARTQEEAITDGLTGVFVHRYFQERLVEEMKRARAQGASLTLIMVDIDNFKRVNDEYGHLTGDGVLKRISQVMKDGVRGTDLVARYGGEEFAVLLVETELEPAHQVAERLRAGVEALVPGELKIHQPVTVSMGLASFPGHAADERALIERADECLYSAKRGGKNRVVVAGAG